MDAMVMNWTPYLVAQRVEEAVDTLKRLPLQRPAGIHSSWPEFIRDIEAYRGKHAAPDELTRVKLGPPEPIAIDQAIEVARWMQWLTRRDQLVVWCKASGRTNDFMEAKFKKNRRTLYRWWSKALKQISRRLNGER